MHGSRKRYHHESIGVNSRLDTLQAAILNVKLKHLEQWHEARRAAARFYNGLFKGANLATPFEAPYHTAYLSPVHGAATKSRQSGRVLNEKKIPHAIFYPIPLHLQEAYVSVGKPKGAFPVTERAAAEVLSLPMHTELTQEQQRTIATAVIEAL